MYISLSYETLSGARNVEFDAVADLASGLSFKINKSTTANGKRQEEMDKKSRIKIKTNHGFFEPPDKF